MNKEQLTKALKALETFDRCTYKLPNGARCILQHDHEGPHDLD